ncbi:hypothetical protein evm_015028 [Chilo suppressalis]|nr:hypothetical protein evm_015028 [Chilo suppressalis]
MYMFQLCSFSPGEGGLCYRSAASRTAFKGYVRPVTTGEAINLTRRLHVSLSNGIGSQDALGLLHPQP